jgi:hypothetical protein
MRSRTTLWSTFRSVRERASSAISRSVLYASLTSAGSSARGGAVAEAALAGLSTCCTAAAAAAHHLRLVVALRTGAGAPRGRAARAAEGLRSILLLVSILHAWFAAARLGRYNSRKALGCGSAAAADGGARDVQDA